MLLIFSLSILLFIGALIFTIKMLIDDVRLCRYTAFGFVYPDSLIRFFQLEKPQAYKGRFKGDKDGNRVVSQRSQLT